jgi:hypothetical protein
MQALVCKHWYASIGMQALAYKHPPAKQGARTRASRHYKLFFVVARPKKSPAASQFCDRDGKRAVSGAVARASRA